MTENFEISEIFVNVKGDYKGDFCHFIGDREELMESVILTGPDIEILKNALNVYDFSVDRSALGRRLITFYTILLN